MILVGGATRLTDSGLSITEWDLGKGLVPPLSAERWAEEFALYRRTVEYQTQNRGMSLDEFQYIYWWEWAHRFLGKLIGLAFAAPFFFFWATGRLRGRLWPLLGLFALGALQGGVGWWMVESGLFSDVNVSPVRLAIHLCLAFVILGVSFWLALGAFGWPERPRDAGAPIWVAAPLLPLLLLQVMFGAFLAGDYGGAAYQDWPQIGGEWIPSGAFELRPIVRNFTENYAAEHLMHRSTGYVVALISSALAGLAAWRGQGVGRTAGLALGAAALAQVGLGVGVVLGGSPLGLSLAHQGGAALVWLCAIGYVRAVLSYSRCNQLK
jgi:cytochrome c oxidase assembly protein subunit 15